ncbi:hypothetical protein KKC00_02520 [Patescibacteria group bacterium]|nr:hypothetical protein [Patescibacteria group bacterium]
MEGLQTETVETTLTSLPVLGGLTSSLRTTGQKCLQIDFLVGVAELNEAGKSSRIAARLSEQTGLPLKDFCCFYTYQKGPNEWRVLTTYGRARVFDFGQRFGTEIFQGHENPKENITLRRLVKLRGELMLESTGLSGGKNIPYPRIEGNNVLLCGDFSLLSSVSFSALHRLLIANYAENAYFVTKRDHCPALVDGFRASRLHLPNPRGRWSRITLDYPQEEISANA